MTNLKKILIVDDDPDVVKWLSILFVENGYQTAGAYDGLEGFDKAQTLHPDLITLDISMAQESGIKMYWKLLNSKELSNIPVIMITGVMPELNEFFARMRRKRSPAGFFEKPIEKEQLLRKVKELIG